MQYDLWEPKRRIERDYARAIKALTKQINNAIAGIEDPAIIVRRLKLIAASPTYKRLAEAAAMKMVTAVFTDAGRTWRQAAKVNTKGKTMYEALIQELQNPNIKGLLAHKIYENAQLISSLQLDLAREASLLIQARTTQGTRPKTIAQEIQAKYPSLSIARANLIARTETSKANTALTQARAINLGLDWYIWRTSKDARVRSSHDHMEGVLINWKDPPSPEALAPQKEQRPYGSYHAGDTFNCRCYPQPVINLDRITWPARVHIAGQIKHVTRANFEKMIKKAA